MSRDRYDLLTNRRKNEIRREVKTRIRSSMTDNRKTKRTLRTSINNGTFKEFGVEVPKPGKFVSDMFNSSRAFKGAYSYARSEVAFYDEAFYADY